MTESIFSGKSKLAGIPGGASKTGVTPLPGLTVTKVPVQPVTAQQVAQVTKITNAQKPKR